MIGKLGKNKVKIAFVIDEESNFSDIMATALRIKGYDVEQCFDATGALNLIMSDIERYGKALMFIDMALEPGSDETIFSLEATDNYMTTGLRLATELVREEVVSKSRRKNMVLYSAHTRNRFWSKIDKFCEDHGTRKWQKRPDADIEEIFDLASEFYD